jgi:hypothetical protein
MRTIETNYLNGSVKRRQPDLSFLFATFLSLLLSSSLFAQVVNVNLPSGGFAIDGGLRANTPASPSPFGPNQGDWYPGLVAGSGGSVFSAADVALNPLTSGHRTDLANSTSDNVFSSGSKFNDYISSLRWANSGALDKGDINNALYHISRDGSNNQWIFIAGDRASTNGTSYIDFEFLQGTVTADASNGTFIGKYADNSSANATGGRTVNDLLISMEYTGGGSKPNVYFYQWKLSGSTYSWQAITPPSGTAFAETNRTAEASLPYSAFGKTSYADSLQFIEAGINITTLLRQTAQACAGLSIKTLWIKTKASAQSTAALKDFVDPIPVSFTFEGTTSITNPDSYCTSDLGTYTLAGSPSGGTFTVDGTPATTFTPSTAGVGSHTIQYTVSGCIFSKAFNVIANPTVYTLSGNSICASAAGTGVITLSNSQTGVSYQLKTSIGNNDVQSAQSGTTGTALTWTGLPAGVSYYVVATGAAPTACTSSTTSATVTEVALPTIYTLSGNSICASAANTGVITLSNSQTGVSYQLKKVSDNSSVQSAQNGTTGTALTWGSLPAGVSYYVTATGATPTSCTSNTGNASITEVANPTIYSLSGNSICASAPNTGVITLSNSQTGVSYQLKKVSDNSSVQSAQNGTTGNALTWGSLPAGVSYYVTATGATPTGCTSNTGNASVSQTANPDPPTVAYNAPACDQATFSIVVSGLQQGDIVTVLDKNGAAIGTLSPTSPYTVPAATTSRSFSGIPAGSGYQVTLSRGGCTSTAQSCGTVSGHVTQKEAPVQSTTLIVEPTVKAYPNPFNDRVKFIINSPAAGNGSLEVYNVMGQRVKTIYQGRINAGNQSYELVIPKKQQETLIYVLRVDGKKVTGKLLQLNN